MLTVEGDPHAVCLPTVRVESPVGDGCRTLLQAAEAEMRAIHGSGQLIRWTSEDLAAPNVQVFVARRHGAPIGCVALIDELHHGVVRRLYVRPEARGAGVAVALLQAVDESARDIGLALLRAETGRAPAPAVELYRRLGYAECPAFGPNPAGGDTVFMEKRLF